MLKNNTLKTARPVQVYMEVHPRVRITMDNIISVSIKINGVEPGDGAEVRT